MGSRSPPPPRAKTPRATRAAPKNVSRSRNDTSHLAQAVAESADGLDQPGLARGVELGSQIADVHGDHIVIRLLARPYGAQKLITREHLPRVPQEVGEEREFTSRQRDQPLTAADLAGLDFDPQIRKLEDGRRRWRSPQQGADAGQQLRVGERLDQVMVGAGVE